MILSNISFRPESPIKIFHNVTYLCSLNQAALHHYLGQVLTLRWSYRGLGTCRRKVNFSMISELEFPICPWNFEVLSLVYDYFNFYSFWVMVFYLWNTFRVENDFPLSLLIRISSILHWEMNFRDQHGCKLEHSRTKIGSS